MPSIAQIVQQIGVPQVMREADIADKAAALIIQDEETTDNGSILSDNDVSTCSGSQSARQEAPVASFMIPSNPASRRDALRKAGQEVLVKISPSGTAPASRKKAQNATAAQQPRRRQQKHKADTVPVGRHQQPKVNAPVVPAAVVTPVPTVPDALEPNSKNTPMKVPDALEPNSKNSPMKVDGMISTSQKTSGLHANSKLDRLLPVKKHPILPEQQKGSYDPNCPLKKRVPQFLLEEAPWGIRA